MNEVIHIFFVDFRFLQKREKGFGEVKISVGNTGCILFKVKF